MSNLAPRRASLLGALAASALLAFAAGTIAVGSAQAATLPTLSIAINSSSATVSGPLESGGVNVAVTDTGVKEAGVIVFLLKPGVSVAEVEAFQREKKGKGDPNRTAKFGSLVFDSEANPGPASELQSELQPGHYIVLVGEGEKPVKLRTNFTVTAAKSPVALPAPQAKIRSIEFGFRGPTTLHDGELVGFEDEGFLVHMDVAFPVKSTKVAQQVVKMLLTGKEKGLEKLIAGPPVTFTGPVSHGAYQQETITAKPGVYVEACFMNTQDGREHTRLGMERIIKIVK
ncbi:MAG: hypothetical protein ACHQAV_03730 [Solirubrobacterales bacterium]